MTEPTHAIVDLHVHILPGMDDGPQSLSDTIELLRVAHAHGVRFLAGTPHMFLEPFNLFVAEEILEKFRQLREDLAVASLQPDQAFLKDLEIYPGAENYASPRFLDYLSRDAVVTLGESRYLLVEFPRLISFPQVSSVVDRIQARELVPVLAHVERYGLFQKKPDQLQTFLERGCLSQVNLGSLLESRWSARGRLVRRLINRDLISIVSSDSHGSKFRPPTFDALLKNPLGLTDDRRIRWCCQNPRWVLGVRGEE